MELPIPSGISTVTPAERRLELAATWKTQIQHANPVLPKGRFHVRI